MNERIKQLRKFYIEEKSHKQYRKAPLNWEKILDAGAFSELSDVEKVTKVFETILEAETPIVFQNEKIPLLRTVVNYPYTLFEEAVRGKSIHENGMLSNICVDYTLLLNCGFNKKIAEIDSLLAKYSGNNEKTAELSCMKRHLCAIIQLCEKYRIAAQNNGCTDIAEALAKVPQNAPENFYEALCMMRIIHYAMWASGAYHNTIGRLDQILFPYYEKDIAGNVISKDDAFELLEEFFLSFNKDSDLYIGVQQGDNGQSIVLGGRDINGNSQYNELSELCLKASLELRVIDPKINLRVDSNTPMSVFELGTMLTKTGLGFPQYMNDDVNIKALTNWGYALEDACNYSAAACWEIIIPGRGMEIPNVGGVSFAGSAERAIREHLKDCTSYEELKAYVKENLKFEADAVCEKAKNIYIVPSPLHSLMMDGCLEAAKDVTEGCIYNNYGIHGAGLSCGADMLAAVKKYIFDEKTVSKDELLIALADNYEGHDKLFHLLRYDSPKMGRDDEADSIGVALLEAFAEILDGRHNDRGGIFRAGTGSAMFYIKFSENLPATADGRKYGEAIPANYSPSLFARCDGPVSIITSFTKPNLYKTANGGPLTLELHDTMFKNSEAIAKTAYLVKSYIDLGGHQLQLNAVNREMLLDAQKKPENYRNLIVRVWGWSGYFTELDKEYQDHIIARCEYTV